MTDSTLLREARALCLWALSLPLAVGCGSESRPVVASSTVVHDSAGVQVITHELDFYAPVQQLGPEVLQLGTESGKVVAWSVPSGEMVEIGPFPGEEVSATGMSLPPFRRTLLVGSLGDDRVVVIDTEYPEVRVFTGGHLLRVVRLTGNQQRDISDETVDELIADQMLMISDRETQRRVAANTRASVTHSSTPALEDLVIGVDASIWVASYSVSMRGPFLWVVLREDGRMESTVVLPEYYFLTAVNDRYVATIHRSDDTNVETVRLFERPTTSR